MISEPHCTGLEERCGYCRSHNFTGTACLQRKQELDILWSISEEEGLWWLHWASGFEPFRGYGGSGVIEWEPLIIDFDFGEPILRAMLAGDI